ncbi:MAG: hypothetical protein N5P05_000195 [Chroococcopsis gigantea SAG 12.99]|jgi:uncharacterized membrane protein (UPF0127 family)/predicted small secreted protein|nr:DUF192 domain-containing protein [Chlorogloea purpurea SAG 13.99]MDV2998589.1 hypothetical protein [Chroococcopsis gigantea SAG 12.99]
MKKRKVYISIVLSLLLWGCNTWSGDKTGVSGPALADAATGGQNLPITSSFKVKDQVIELEVARTPEQQETGLMYRTSLPRNRGMLFPFPSPRITRFWMKNVYIPLDMVFLKDGQIKEILANVPPCKADPCPVYGTDGLVDAVIELSGGRAGELGLKPGDRINIISQ